MLQQIKEFPKGDKKVLVKAGLVIFLFLWPVLWTEFRTEQKYSYDPESDGAHIIKVVLRFDQYEGDPIFVDIPLNATHYTDKSEKLFRSHEYTFLLKDFNMNSTWADLNILYFIDESGYENYREIICEWRVELEQNTLSKSHKSFIFNGNEYVATDPEIDNAMFKDAVPTRVEAYVKLYTG